MNAARIFGQAGVLLATMVSGASAFAYCSYSSPSASVSVQSPGSPAGVQVQTARITGSINPGSLNSGSDSYCSTSSSYSTSIYIDNRYIGSGSVDFNTATVSDGLHTIIVYGNDSNGGSASASQQIVIRNNWVRPEVWDITEYASLNPDVANAFPGRPDRILAHWLYFGVREGRPSRYIFSVKEYVGNYGDLTAVFGTNYPSAIDHFITNGLSEGRAGVYALRPEVFNVDYYYAMYPDLQAAFPGNVPLLRQHWAQFGVSEGRRALPTFSPVTYLNRYGDLQAAFGAGNYRAAVQHYIQYGLSEGRSGN